jgi:hypothetical protein
MGHRQSRLERILDRKDREFTSLARRAARMAWGSPVISHEDFKQEALVTALDVYRRHHRTKNDDDLERLMHKAIVYQLWGTWNEDSKYGSGGWHGEVEHMVHTVELTTDHIDPTSDEFQNRYVMFFLQEAKKILSQFEYELLTVLIEPDNSVTAQFCYDLFKVVNHRPIQRGEFFYLSLYFNMPVQEIQTHYYRIREKLIPILEAVA